VGECEASWHQLVQAKSTKWAPIRCHLQHQLVPLALLLSFARQRKGCLPINRQCILAIYITTQERNKRARRESVGE